MQTKTLQRGELVGGCRFSALPVSLGDERTAEEAGPKKDFPLKPEVHGASPCRPPEKEAGRQYPPHYPLHIAPPKLQKAKKSHSSKNTAAYTLLGSDHARTAPSRYARHEYMRHADKKEKSILYRHTKRIYTRYNVNFRHYI